MATPEEIRKFQCGDFVNIEGCSLSLFIVVHPIHHAGCSERMTVKQTGVDGVLGVLRSSCNKPVALLRGDLVRIVKLDPWSTDRRGARLVGQLARVYHPTGSDIVMYEEGSAEVVRGDVRLVYVWMLHPQDSRFRRLPLLFPRGCVKFVARPSPAL